MTGLYLSRLTVLCTVHALCVATLVRAIVLQCFLSHRSVVFVYPPTTPVHLPCLWTHSVRSSFVSLLSLDHSGAASGIILLKVWQFAAFVDVVLVSSNWIDLELKNSHSASSRSPWSRGQRLSFNLLPTHCGQCAAPGCLR